MKTRDQIYGQEAARLLRDVTMYRALTKPQLLALYPGKKEKIAALLNHLVRQGRIFYDSTNDCYHADAEMKQDAGMMAAVWVLIDFIEEVEFHSVSDYPAKLLFFAGVEVYEVIYVPLNQEALINQLWVQKEEQPPRRIVLVDMPEQIPRIHIPGCSGYCTVSPAGSVTYFQKEAN